MVEAMLKAYSNLSAATIGIGTGQHNQSSINITASFTVLQHL